MGKDVRHSTTDRYNPETGARQVAGVVVLSNACTNHELNRYVLCITSSRHPNKLVLPKGGWEIHESVEEAALRECWEEAGVKGTITRFLTHSLDARERKAEYRYYQVSPVEVADTWPEPHRQRKWLTFEEASACLKPEMVTALRESDILR